MINVAECTEIRVSLKKRQYVSSVCVTAEQLNLFLDSAVVCCLQGQKPFTDLVCFYGFVEERETFKDISDLIFLLRVTQDST